MRRMILVGAFLLALGSTANAMLFDRGAGLIYDDVLNVTWLQDANYANTQGYDDALYGYDTNGGLTHDDAVKWADALAYSGYDDWRLPNTFKEEGGWHDGSEMGKLYYMGLNNTAQDLSPDMGPFINVQPYWYRSSKEVESSTIFDWGFSFRDIPSSTEFNESGYQATPDMRVPEAFAWAVRDGDSVAPIPEPATILLFGSGLLGAFIRRRR